MLQYADNITFACQNVNEIDVIMKELFNFEKASGLKIHLEKTQILISNQKILH